MLTLAEMRVGESYEELVRYEGFAVGLSEEHGLVFILTALFANAEQRKQLVEGELELRILRQDQLILFLARLGSLSWLEAPYALSAELVEQGLLQLPYQAPRGGVPYTFIIGDGATGELLSKREGRLTVAGTRKLVRLLEEAWEQKPLLSAEDCSALYSQLGHEKTSEQLARMAGRGYHL